MSDIALTVEGLSKRYRIGERTQAYQTLRDSLTGLLLTPYRRIRTRLQTADENSAGDNLIWALKNVSFEVRRGEVIGIIGRNGAGKSTLLKVLSRVTEPTTGYAELCGRVGSLLEVGTGFHPELTGRENVYLNGAILGMRRQEIHKKFEEIVAFAGIDRFIDTQVKFYSSGMYLRLAFGVAAHFEPEILVVDEVLAVGDLDFQKKCLGRMSEVAREGRTVLFVSHNLTAISSLTERCLLLSDGQVAKYGETEGTIAAYHASLVNAQVNLADRTDRTGSGQIRFTALEILNGDTGEAACSICSGQGVRIRLYWECAAPVNSADAAMDIRVNSSLGVPIASFSSRFEPWEHAPLPKRGASECIIPSFALAPDDYTLDIWAGIRNRQADYLGSAALLPVRMSDYFGTGQMPQFRKHGAALLRHSWTLFPNTPAAGH
ncbi:MAG: ABC transporter ATP-binding protein [Bryobacterales bacterium]|nr:ABC transporter ATP-binding protein [Bryobacterales bacterium]